MARKQAPARLKFDLDRGVWAIHDTVDGKPWKRRTRHRLENRSAAESEFAVHLAERSRAEQERLLGAPDADDPANKDPRLISIATCLAHYGALKEGTRNAALTGQHLTHLLRHWKGKTLAQITGKSCRAYVAGRTAETYSAPGSAKLKRVKPATARRELQTLSAAIGAWHAEFTLHARPKVSMPPAGEAHPDWLTEGEYARLLKAAQGYRWASTDLATREPQWVRIEGLTNDPSDHLARFCEIGFYSGTRSAAILDLRWRRHRTAGFVDFTSMTLFRVGPEAPKTRKTQTPCRIHDRLLPLFTAWREADLARGIGRVVHDHGTGILRVSKGFRLAAIRACLDLREIDGTYRVGGEALAFEADEDAEADVVAEVDEEAAEDAVVIDEGTDELGWPTPHILRHTRATLMLRAGVPVVEVADYLGMTPAMVLKVYGHTASEYQKRAAAA